MMEYYYIDAQDKHCGPYTIDVLRAMLAKGQLTPETIVITKEDGKRQNISALIASAEQSTEMNVGNCPKCGGQITLINYQLPIHCPHCKFRLCADAPYSSWSNCKLAFSKMFELRGRASYREYWSYYGCSGICSFTIVLVYWLFLKDIDLKLTTADVHEPSLKFILFVILLLFFGMMAIPQFTVLVRRLHDVGRSGKLLLIPFSLVAALAAIATTIISGVYTEICSDALTVLLCAGGVIFLAFLGTCIYILSLIIEDSQRGPNKYGPSPIYPRG